MENEESDVAQSLASRPDCRGSMSPQKVTETQMTPQEVAKTQMVADEILVSNGKQLDEGKAIVIFNDPIQSELHGKGFNSPQIPNRIRSIADQDPDSPSSHPNMVAARI